MLLRVLHVCARYEKLVVRILPHDARIVLINGAFKTMDIEMNLITGVHGPKQLYVLAVEGM